MQDCNGAAIFVAIMQYHLFRNVYNRVKNAVFIWNTISITELILIREVQNE